MKRFLYIFILMAPVTMGVVAYSQSSLTDVERYEQDSSLYGFRYVGESTFKFINRGVNYDARNVNDNDPNNLAMLHYGEVSNGNILVLYAFDADVPERDRDAAAGLRIQLYLGDKELKIGTYPFGSYTEFQTCESQGFKGCTPITVGSFSLVGPSYDYDFMIENALSSVSGELEITDFQLGKFIAGMTKGTISGKFSFKGYSDEYQKENPGTASGVFENVKLTLFKFNDP